VKALRIRDRLTHPKSVADVSLSAEDVEVVREAKGMVLGYLEVVLNPRLIAVINAHIEIAKSEGRKISLTLTEDDLGHFKE
jgi:sugar/nucleoside kinase (ribokinase family)